MGYKRAKPYTCCDDAWYKETDTIRDDGTVEAKSECQNCDAEWKDVFTFSHAELDVSEATTQFNRADKRSCCDDPSIDFSSTWNEGKRMEVFKTCLNCDADWKYVFIYSHAMVLEESLS